VSLELCACLLAVRESQPFAMPNIQCNNSCPGLSPSSCGYQHWTPPLQPHPQPRRLRVAARAHRHHGQYPWSKSGSRVVYNNNERDLSYRDPCTPTKLFVSQRFAS
jgi:hypothetical protein